MILKKLPSFGSINNKQKTNKQKKVSATSSDVKITPFSPTIRFKEVYTFFVLVKQAELKEHNEYKEEIDIKAKTKQTKKTSQTKTTLHHSISTRLSFTWLPLPCNVLPPHPVLLSMYLSIHRKKEQLLLFTMFLPYFCLICSNTCSNSKHFFLFLILFFQITCLLASVVHLTFIFSI